MSRPTGGDGASQPDFVPTEAPLRWALHRFRTNWNDWSWYYAAVLHGVLPLLADDTHNDNGVDVMARRWDTLLVVDACRYDLFRDCYGDFFDDGHLERCISSGSSTPAFLRANFAGEQYGDTVYVTANPHLSKLGLEECFHEVVDVWRTGWDESLDTVPPGEVVDATLAARRRYPDKRLIAHFMQPHIPFIGAHARDGAFYQVALRDGLDAVEKAYEGNLRHVLDRVADLVAQLGGVTVVTSDHGNAMGERGPLGVPVYDHPTGIHIPALVEVPWYVTESAAGPDRQPIGRAEIPDSSDATPVDERLEALGYRS